MNLLVPKNRFTLFSKNFLFICCLLHSCGDKDVQNEGGKFSLVMIIANRNHLIHAHTLNDGPDPSWPP